MNYSRLIAAAIAASTIFSSCSNVELTPAVGNVKPRVIVTCDPELDDNNSLIRYLLFSDGYDTEGLIYAAGSCHWKGDGNGTIFTINSRGGAFSGPSYRWKEGERFIDEEVEAYEKAYENLKVHSKDYPTPEYLKSIIAEGNVMVEGDMGEDTPGSDLIKKVLLDDDMRPVFLQVWGGPGTVARALKSIQDEYENTPEWEVVKAKVNAKARLCLSGAQDNTYTDYIRPNWPDVISVIKNTGITPMGYGAHRGIADPADALYYSPEWTGQYIKGIDSELSENYRVWGDGKIMCPGDMADYFHLAGYTKEELTAMGFSVWSDLQPKGAFISEGDTPEFLNIIGNGLRAWENPTWGGWAGRQKELSDREKSMGYTMAFAAKAGDDTLPDFVADCQNDFAIRMAWTATSDFAAVNHEPVVTGPLDITAEAGKTVKIKANATDPDGDELTYSWAQWKIYEAYQGGVTFSSAATPSTEVTIPADAKSGEQIHLILTVRDDGTPSGTSYLRTVITVK